MIKREVLFYKEVYATVEIETETEDELYDKIDEIRFDDQEIEWEDSGWDSINYRIIEEG